MCDLRQRYGSSFLLAVGSAAATLDQGTAACLITVRVDPSLKALIEAMTVDTLVAKDRFKFIELIDDSWV